MIPLRDNVPRTSFPFITLLLIASNCFVFIKEVSLAPLQRNAIIQNYALIPARTAAFLAGGHVSAARALLPFLTHMFLHGGWMHLIGNMWFLWIFGDNVEDRVGHFRYVFLYLFCGLAGAAAEFYFSFNSRTPMLGASGAIAGIMGAYLVTFPEAKVKTLVPLFIFLTTWDIPAPLMLLYWFMLQFLSGFASLQIQDQGGVAWFAHVGGFLIGIPLMFWLRQPKQPKRRAQWA